MAYPREAPTLPGVRGEAVAIMIWTGIPQLNQLNHTARPGRPMNAITFQDVESLAYEKVPDPVLREASPSPGRIGVVVTPITAIASPIPCSGRHRT